MEPDDREGTDAREAHGEHTRLRIRRLERGGRRRLPRRGAGRARQQHVTHVPISVFEGVDRPMELMAPAEEDGPSTDETHAFTTRTPTLDDPHEPPRL